MAWYKFICMHGPGHQSEDEKYYFHVRNKGKTVQEALENWVDCRLYDLDNPVARAKRIKSPPRDWFEKELHNVQSMVRYHKEYLEFLKQELKKKEK